MSGWQKSEETKQSWDGSAGLHTVAGVNGGTFPEG